MAVSHGSSPCARPGGRQWKYHAAASLLSRFLRPLLLLLLLAEVVPLQAIADATTVETTTAAGAGITTVLPPCDVHGVASRDVTLQNGSTFEMTCTLTRWPPKEKFKLAVLRSWDRPVPTTELHTNSATSVTWRRPNVKDADTATYYCLVSGDGCESVYNATALRVGYFPMKPLSPSCSGDLETFTCEWELPDNRIETRYEVVLRVGLDYAFTERYCNATVGLKPRNLTCQLRTSGDVIYRIEEKVFKFVIKGSNKFGAEQWEYNVDHFANVMLYPPRVVDCSAKAFNASINWTGLPQISTFPNAVYEVRLRWDYGEDITASVENTLDTSVDNLVPNTRYDVSVRVKFAKARDQLWSPFSKSGYCKTSKSRATVLPKITENSFIIQDLDDHRKVRLFYQRVPRFLWNGDHMGYVLHWCSSSGQCATHRVSGERSYTDMFHLSRVETYTFKLYSENELGRSLKSVRLLVPSADLVLPAVQDAYIVQEGLNRSRFKLPELRSRKPDEVQHYTLFWCSEGTKEMDSCSGDVFWATVKSAGDALTAMECAFAGRCKYAVATRSAHAVSPMTWIDCVVPNSNEYENLFKGQDVVHYDKITDTAVQLAFLTKCSGLVAGRSVLVCVTQGEHERRGNETLQAAVEVDLTTCFNQTAGHEKTMLLENLSPATTYLLNVTTVLEDGSVLKHRPLIIETQAKASTYLATSLIVAYVIVVALAVLGVVFWRRISVYVKVYKNTTVSVLVPPDFTKEPLKKSESVRSNLREYVLGSKDSPYGLPQIIPRENKEFVSSLQYPELDRLLQDTLTCDENDASATTCTTSSSELSLPTNHPPTGYSLVSTTTQGEPEPALGSAYSKFSTFQDASKEVPPPLLKNDYSRLSSLFLGGFGTREGEAAPSVPEQNGYSKFAAFLDNRSVGGGNDPEEALKSDHSDASKEYPAASVAPYVQAGDGFLQRGGEPYTKLGCTSVQFHAVPLLGQPDRAENRTSGYTPLPTLMAMCGKPGQCKSADDKPANYEYNSTRRSTTELALGQSEFRQPYMQASTICALSPVQEDLLPEADVPCGPYTIINADELASAKECLPSVHCVPHDVKAACDPDAPRTYCVPRPSAKTEDVPAPAYSKVGVRAEQCADSRQELHDSTTRSTQPLASVPENYALAALPTAACCEQTERGAVGDQCSSSFPPEADDLLSEEYSGPTKDTSSVRLTLCNGGYTSWETLAKQKDCGTGLYARAVKNA